MCASVLPLIWVLQVYFRFWLGNGLDVYFYSAATIALVNSQVMGWVSQNVGYAGASIYA